jgi:hypothetical protein
MVMLIVVFRQYLDQSPHPRMDAALKPMVAKTQVFDF